MTDRPPVDIQDDIVIVGSAEMSYLFAQNDVQKRRLLADAISADLTDVRTEVLAAGASALHARGLLVPSDSGFDVTGAAAVLTVALADARRIVDLALYSGDGSARDAMVFVVSDGVTVLLQPRYLGAWAIAIKVPGVSNGEAVWEIAERFFHESPRGSVSIGARESAWSASLAFQREEEHGDTWEVVRAGSALWTDETHRSASEEFVRSSVDVIVG